MNEWSFYWEEKPVSQKENTTRIYFRITGPSSQVQWKETWKNLSPITFINTEYSL
jgi:hypothetical protein